MNEGRLKSFMPAGVIFLSIFVLWSSSVAKSQGVPPSGSERAPVLADRNQSGISDSLEEKLAEASPGERFDVVVTFRVPGGLAFAQQAVGGFELKREFQIIHGFAASMTAGQIWGVARVPGVFRIEEDVEVSIKMDAARRDFGVETARVRFPVDGSGTVICVVDTGVDPNHEQLDSKTLLFFDAINGLAAPYDDHGHGTHVAAIAAGDGAGGPNALAFQGVAPGADVYAAKVLSSAGSGSLSGVIAGVEWCADQSEVNIVSMSLGTEGGSDGGDSLSQAVNAAVITKGKVVVVAAGNSGDAPETVGSPGAAEEPVTVGAVAEWSAPVGTDRHSHGVYLMAFSSRGPTLDGRIKPDIAAPGATIRSARAGTQNGYITFSGTSMATPFVSGAMALALDANPSLTPEELKGLVQATAQDRGPDGKDNDWGAGLLDVHELVAAAVGQADFYEPTAFPFYRRVPGSVSDNGLWSYDFQLDDADLQFPIGATLTIEGQLSCTFFFFGFCWIWEWSPDLDARLIDPSGTVIATSECPAFGECAGVGRQETLRAMPTVSGFYAIEVWPYSGSPNNGKGGSFALDLSTGPLAETAEPPEPVDFPPTANIVQPTDGSSVTGSVTIQVDAADAEDPLGSLTVEVSIGGGAWEMAGYDPDSGYYERVWDTGSLSDGTAVTIGARATDSAANTTEATTIAVTVEHSTPGSAHVGDLDGSSAAQGRNHWTATVTVLLHDDSHDPLAGATVQGTWSQGASGSAQCTTGADGRCSVTSSNIHRRNASVAFTVQDVGHESLPYQPEDNHDPDGDSDGTSILVSAP